MALTYLIAVVIMTAVKVLIETSHKLDLSPSALNQSGYIVYNVKGIGPFVP